MLQRNFHQKPFSCTNPLKSITPAGDVPGAPDIRTPSWYRCSVRGGSAHARHGPLLRPPQSRLGTEPEGRF